MTIYAIVNSILGSSTNPHGSSPAWTVITPSAILQGGNPYFVPDFDQRFEARPAIALKIGKLGKGIAQRFVQRYVDGVAPACLMVAADLLNNLRTSGMPWSKAISYDRSLAIGRFSSIPFDEIDPLTVSLDLISESHREAEEYKPSTLQFSIEETISALSRDNALKTGDTIIVGISPSGPLLCQGQRIILKLKNEEALKFNIR